MQIYYIKNLVYDEVFTMKKKKCNSMQMEVFQKYFGLALS